MSFEVLGVKCKKNFFAMVVTVLHVERLLQRDLVTKLEKTRQIKLPR